LKSGRAGPAGPVESLIPTATFTDYSRTKFKIEVQPWRRKQPLLMPN